MKNKYFKIISAFLFCVVVLSCRKNLQLDPPVYGLVSQTVYTNNATAAAALTGIYGTMSNTGLSDGAASISLIVGLSSDELTNYNTGDLIFPGIYSNTLNSTNKYFWTELYHQIYAANAAIQGLSTSTGLDPGLKRQLSGEARFMRAFLHFYAVNLYGNVPLVTTTDYRVNNAISRSDVQQVYQQIIADLEDAQGNLGAEFATPTGGSTAERVRPNKGAATALLARAYLYTGNWVGADSAATAVITNSAKYELVTSLDSVFLANSKEAIWELQPVAPETNTYDAYSFVLTDLPGSGNNPVAMSEGLHSAFEPGDARFMHWVGTFNSGAGLYYYPFKYKVYQQNEPLTEYTMVLRLAEQFLIRAEARAKRGNITGPSGALADLNRIRGRASLPDYAGPTDQASVLEAILHERRVELFTEWGHRWFDLKRTGTINSVMGSPGNACQAKGGTWNPDWALYPIPQAEILINPNLTQNPGYQ